MIAIGCNSDRYRDDYVKLGTAPGACHHCATGQCPVGIATQDEGLERRLDPDTGAQALANYLHAITMEASLLAKACGKRNVHSLEPEDMRALTLEASAVTGVPLVGVDKVFKLD